MDDPNQDFHQVLSKDIFYRRWQAGLFGNRIRIWNSLNDLLNSSYTGLVTVRYKEVSTPYVRYLVPVTDVTSVIQTFVKQGAKLDLFTFNESAPDDNLIFQGEVIRQNIPHFRTSAPYLFYSLAKLPMRKALAQSPQELFGIQALIFMRKFMTENSFIDLEDLWEQYPTSTVEFSVYNMNLGIYPYRNMIIWEVRDY